MDKVVAEVGKKGNCESLCEYREVVVPRADDHKSSVCQARIAECSEDKPSIEVPTF